MTSTDFEGLLAQADACARRGAWQEALDSLGQAAALDPGHAGTQTGLGTCLIQLGRPADSLPYFQQAAALAPESPEAHNNLGVAQALCGDLAAAETAYQAALSRDAEHAPAWKNLAQLYMRQGRFVEGIPILAALTQSHPQDADAPLLLAGCYEEAGDLASARTLYAEALRRRPGDAEAQAALARLEGQAARIAKPEHARKLAGLKKIKSQTSNSKSQDPNPKSPNGAAKGSIVFYAPAGDSFEVRAGLPARALAGNGLSVKAAATPDPADGDRFDVCVFARPHTAPELMKRLEACARAGREVVVDLDEDFHSLPPDHPAYAAAGPGNPAALRALEAAIAQAGRLTVASPVLAERYGRFARRVEIVPSGWSRGNPLWDKPAPRRQTLNIGWAGALAERADAALIRQAVIRLVRETPEALLVVAGEPAVYFDFSALPEARRLYLPPMAYEDFPFTLAHFDILLLPWRETDFNQARSDLAVLEAGVRRLPWVASPLPAYRAWGVGGLFAEHESDWYPALRRLATDPALRRELGEAGRQKAQEREVGALAAAWRNALLDTAPAQNVPAGNTE